MQPRMEHDDVPWEKYEEIADNYCRQFFEPEILRPEFSFLKRGTYNIALKMTYSDDSSVVISFPQPGAIFVPDRRIEGVSVPFIYHWASREESPLGLGPCIVMDLEHSTSMYEALNYPGCPDAERGHLDPDIEEGKLEALYGEAAGISLRLSQSSWPRIGALEQIDDFTWDVTRRPFKAPNTTFDTAAEYFESLAELHITHLIHQRNDAIYSADDCRHKLSRLMERWASTFGKGPFKLWCDDLRLANILMNDESKIVGVVDWEFTYAAPVKFSYAPSWWPLIERPDYWESGLEDWCCTYERRLQTFLSAMNCREDEAIQQGWLEDAQRLSGPMRDSWESGDFWTSYAARDNFAFDLIYWYKIDQFFGGLSSACPIEDVWKQRIELLEPGERAEMEKIVATKLEEMETRPLAWDPDEYIRELVEKGFGVEAPAVSEGKEIDAEAEVDDGDVGSDKLAELSLTS
ncbi:hypothetical protein BDW69DRAFT_192484 [Aspergillus filifer]